MEEKTLLKSNQHKFNDYLNNLAEAVCINGDALEKYEKVITKQYGEEVYNNMKLFVEELHDYVKRKSFTHTSKVNLGFLGKNAGLSESTIHKIIVHYENQKHNESSKSKWTVLFILLVLLGIGVFVFLYEKEEPIPLKVENFVNQTELNAESYGTDDWVRTSNTFDSLIYVYGSIYKELPLQDIDKVDEAIDRYYELSRKYALKEDTSKVIVDDIEFTNSEMPSKEWMGKYANICKSKIQNLNCDDYTIPHDMMRYHPCLVYLVLKSKSLSTKSEKQSWFDLYSLMDDEKVDRLYGILYEESYKLGRIDIKYERERRANQYNKDAYEYANKSDFYNAMRTINKAIDICPEEANYYDSKGEFCIMQGRQERALALWNKVMELDPDFLQKTSGGTTKLYEQLKEHNLVK